MSKPLVQSSATGAEIRLTYTPEKSPKHEVLSQIVKLLKLTEHVEIELSNLDIGDDIYRTLAPVVKRLRSDAKELNQSFQRNVYRRPYADRNITPRENSHHSPIRR